MSADFSPQERQRLISMYTTQYNQTNVHINRLFNTLDDIRHNLNILIGNNNNNNNNNNMNRQYRLNRPNRTTPVRERYINPSHPHVYYDYANPIDRSTYISENDNENNTNTSDISNFLSDIITNNISNTNTHNNSTDVNRFITDFLNSVPIRPTQEQINIASRLVSYSDIQTPNSASCAISLEPFTPSDTVIQLHHCQHIFFPEQFNQWFSKNVRCPVCRHDIRSAPNDTNLNPVTNVVDLPSVDLSNNELSRFLIRLFNPLPNSNNTNNTNNTNTNTNDNDLFETILRSNNL